MNKQSNFEYNIVKQKYDKCFTNEKKCVKLQLQKGVLIMAQAMINFRMDEELKKSMEETCRDLGLSMTTAFTIFAKKMTREKRIPFEVSVDPFYSESNMTYLKKVVEDIESGKAVLVEHELIEEQGMKILWDERAWEEYLEWQMQDKNIR